MQHGKHHDRHQKNRGYFVGLDHIFGGLELLILRKLEL
jgi:hypothetical protein